jgi:hypothetical protein
VAAIKCKTQEFAKVKNFAFVILNGVFIGLEIMAKLFSVQNKVLVNIYLSMSPKSCCFVNCGGYKMQNSRICKKLILSS